MSCSGSRQEHVVQSELQTNMRKLLARGRELTFGLHQCEILVDRCNQLRRGRHVNEAIMGIEELELSSIDPDRFRKIDIVGMLQFAAITGCIFFENRLDELAEADHGILSLIKVKLLVGEHQFREICLETTCEGRYKIRIIAVEAFLHFFSSICFTDVHIQLSLPQVVSFEE